MEGKLHTLLRTLAQAAAFHLRHEGTYHHTQKLKDNGWKPTAMPTCGIVLLVVHVVGWTNRRIICSCLPDGDEGADGDLGAEQQDDCICDSQAVAEAVRTRRSDKVRAMVRELVIKYPLILGTSMNRISERLEAMQAAHYHSVWHQNDAYCSDIEQEGTTRVGHLHAVSIPPSGESS